jgi:DNA-binding Lrp family transcriptional regulator
LAKKTLEEHNKWPDDYTSEEDVAKELGCSPSAVRSILKNLIGDGSVIRKPFKIWDPGSEQFVTRVGYKQLGKEEDSERNLVVKDKIRCTESQRRGIVIRSNAREFCVRWTDGRESRHRHGVYRSGRIVLSKS